MNVLFICRDNCALSLMAECILRSVGQGRFGTFSAGLVPGAVATGLEDLVSPSASLPSVSRGAAGET